MKPWIRRSWPVLAVLLFAGSTALGQRIPKPGFNLFSKQQDIQIGREGAAQIEKKMKLVTNREVLNYIRGIGRKLAQTPEADHFPYTFHVVQDKSINAFALPGGPTYFNTGLILAAENEAQLAGVMGHEMAHIALRHGTNQASKANLLQLGVMMGSSMLGGGSIMGQLAQLGIGFGANSVLLKFSRAHERDADIQGARMMAAAGYNPIEEARFFEKLQAETGKRSGLQEFFSDHPNPGHRMARIEQEIQYFPRRNYITDTGRLARIQRILRGLKPVTGRRPARVRQQPETWPRTRTPAASGRTGQKPAAVRPSATIRLYRGRGFEVSYPADWRRYENRGGGSITFAPPNGMARTVGGRMAIGRGVVISVVPGNGGRGADLARDTKSFIAQLRQHDPSLRAAGPNARHLRVSGNPALLNTLYSNSPYANETEIDMLLTAERPQGLFVMVFIAPQSEYRLHQRAFEKMLNSIRFTR